MDPQRQERIDELFEAALELPPERRAAFLDGQASGDPALRAEVERLLLADQNAGNFLDTPYLRPQELKFKPAPERIGPYKILHSIGQGGMGQVFLAEREGDFSKKVAIKVVLGESGSPDMLRRFRTERQIQARLDHPNIARLLDGGVTDDGRLYFVMDYIEGLRIDEYCREKKLGVDAILDLFLHVCSAVEYAHKNLIVHRDLKPGNILVTADGVPKLLDFGIAKVLRPDQTLDDDETQTGMVLMTPPYASPEQVRAEPITTASDVYSLAVVLFELLTGRRPYRLRSAAQREIERVICEQPPERPSTAVSTAREEFDPKPATDSIAPYPGPATQPTRPVQSSSRALTSDERKLKRRLEGDLDNILLMALRKEPQRRYGSVDQFAGDIRRHLTGLPVTAQPDTLGYRAAKFVRRNKASVAAAAAFVLALVGGIITTTWQARLAERRFEYARSLAHTFLFDFHDKIDRLSGSMPARRLVAERGTEYLDRLNRESSGDESLQNDLGEGYMKVGDVLGNPFGPNLGQNDDALLRYQTSSAIFQKLAQKHPNDTHIRRQLAEVTRRIGEIQALKGDLKGAMATYDKAAAMIAGIDEMEALGLTALINGRMSQILAQTGHKQEAIVRARKRLEGEKLALSHLAPGKWDERTGSLVVAYGRLASLLADENLDEALQNFQSSVDASEKLLPKHPHDVPLRMNLAQTQESIGELRAIKGDIPGAMEMFGKALPEVLNQNEKEPGDVIARGNAAGYLRAIAKCEPDRASAAGHFAESIARFEKLATDFPGSPRWQVQVAASYREFGAWRLKIKDARGALPLLQRALPLSVAAAQRNARDMGAQSNLALTQRSLCDALRETGGASAALDHGGEGVRLARSLAGRDPGDSHAKQNLVETLTSLGLTQEKLGRTPEALASFKEATALNAALMRSNPSNREHRENQADLTRALGSLNAQPAAAPR